jgi:glucosamine 6-phosphate synthetase-like amidotransferase/phosphosugar isomerase protein
MEEVIERVPYQIRTFINETSKSFKKIIMVGSGTSLNAAIATKYAMNKFNEANVDVMSPFEFNNYYPIDKLNDETLVIGISQTSRSTATLNSLELAKINGSTTLLVTAEKDRPSAKIADFILDTCTGSEPVGPKSKGYTSTVATLLFLAASLGGKELDLTNIPSFMRKVLEVSLENLNPNAELLHTGKSFVILSYGSNMASAFEGGLKILETVRIPVEVYDVEEYMHGPYHCLNKDSHIIFIAPPGKGQKRMQRLIEFVHKHTEHTLVITDESLASEVSKGSVLILPNDVDHEMTSLGYIIPLQLLADELTKKMGRHPEASGHPDFHAFLGSKLPQTK